MAHLELQEFCTHPRHFGTFHFEGSRPFLQFAKETVPSIFVAIAMQDDIILKSKIKLDAMRLHIVSGGELSRCLDEERSLGHRRTMTQAHP